MKKTLYVMPENERFQPYGDAVFETLAAVEAELDAQGVVDAQAREDYIAMLEEHEIDLDKSNLSREEAIAHVGLKNVEAAEADNCEPTSRAYDHEEGEIEWRGSVEIDDYDGLEMADELPIGGCRLEVYYYTDAADAEAVEENGGDWGALAWTPHHYAIA